MIDDVLLTTATWSVGICANCLILLDPARVTKRLLCSDHCQVQAADILYARSAIRDGRTGDPMTQLVS